MTASSACEIGSRQVLLLPVLRTGDREQILDGDKNELEMDTDNAMEQNHSRMCVVGNRHGRGLAFR